MARAGAAVVTHSETVQYVECCINLRSAGVCIESVRLPFSQAQSDHFAFKFVL